MWGQRDALAKEVCGLWVLLLNIKCVLVTDKPTTSIRAEDDQVIPKDGIVYSLVCVVDARPEPGETDYTWRRKGTTIPSEKRNKLTQTLDHTQHDGPYTCEATNIVDTGTSDDYPFNVRCKLMNNNFYGGIPAK